MNRENDTCVLNIDIRVERVICRANPAELIYCNLTKNGGIFVVCKRIRFPCKPRSSTVFNKYNRGSWNATLECLSSQFFTNARTVLFSNIVHLTFVFIFEENTIVVRETTRILDYINFSRARDQCCFLTLFVQYLKKTRCNKKRETRNCTVIKLRKRPIFDRFTFYTCKSYHIRCSTWIRIAKFYRAENESRCQ